MYVETSIPDWQKDFLVSEYISTFDGSSFFYNKFEYESISGPWGKGSLPEGMYTASYLRDRTIASMTDPDGLGWSVNLDPNFSTDRNLLRIHPDGNTPGTEGCIGIKGSTRFLYMDLKNNLGIQNTSNSFQVQVKY